MATQKNVGFKGISRVTDTDFAQEGDFIELIDAQVRNGSLSTVPPPVLLRSLSTTYSDIYYHSKSGKYLAITGNGVGTVHLLNEDFSNGSPLLLNAAAVGVKRIELMGNLVCMLTDSTILYALFDTNSYVWLGEKPALPTMTISYTSKVHSITTEDEYYSGDTRNVEEDSLFWDNVSKGYFDRCIANLNKEGYFIDRSLFRFAFRLYDGNYILHSPVYYVEDNNTVSNMSRDDGNFISYPTGDIYSRTVKSTFVTKVLGFKPTFTFSSIDLTTWKNLVLSIDLFAVPAIMGHKVVSEGGKTLRRDGTSESEGSSYENETSGAEYDCYELKTDNELWKDVADAYRFYKIAEFDLEGNQRERLDNVSSDNLALQEMLSDDEATHHSRTGTYSYVYNSRLHLSNITTTLFSGYASDYLLKGGNSYPTSNRVAQAKVYVYINTSEGTSVVSRTFTGNLFPADYISPYLMYPDQRAFKMVIDYARNGAFFQKIVELKPHKYLNIAYYLNAQYNGTYNTVVSFVSTAIASVLVNSPRTFAAAVGYLVGSYSFQYNTSNSSWMSGSSRVQLSDYSVIVRKGENSSFALGDTITVVLTRVDGTAYGIAPIDMSLFDSVSLVPTEQNASEHNKNLLKVSAVDNPLYFPAATAYTPSAGEIRALCSNTTALSQGQFGQHPLYIFCSDGIWAMTVDASGGTAYANCIPVSRDVCNHGENICAIDKGIIFTTEEGVMLLQGTQTSLLSGMLDNARLSPIGVSVVLHYNNVLFYRYTAGDTMNLGNTYYAWQSAGGLVRYTQSFEPLSGDAVYLLPSLNSNSGVATSYEVEPLNLLGEIAETAHRMETVSKERFKDYCAGCKIGYIYRRNELVVANASYPFVFVLDLETGYWSKRSYCVRSFVNSYPHAFACLTQRNATIVCNLDNKEESVSSFLAVTRPLLLESEQRKRLLQATLIGGVETAQGELMFVQNEQEIQLNFRNETLHLFGGVGLYVLGSNDGEHFDLLVIKKREQSCRNMVCKMNRSKGYKYLLVGLAGEMSTGGQLDFMELVVEETWNNRLR